MTINTTPVLRAAPLVLALSLSACAGMSGIRPQSSPRDAASLGLNAGQTGASIAAEWWREFGDEQLNRLIAQALDSSPSLKLAQARLARAQAASEVADAATSPQLNGALDLTHQR